MWWYLEIGGGGYLWEVIKFRWESSPWDKCLYKKRTESFLFLSLSHHQPSGSQKEGSQQSLTMLAPWSQTSQSREQWETAVFCLSHPDCGILLQQPELRQVLTALFLNFGFFNYGSSELCFWLKVVWIEFMLFDIKNSDYSSLSLHQSASPHLQWLWSLRSKNYLLPFGLYTCSNLHPSRKSLLWSCSHWLFSLLPFIPTGQHR